MSSDDSIFDLEPGADHSAIRRAWKRAAKRWHPDRPQGDAQRFIAAHKAYELLMQWSPRRQIHEFRPSPCKPTWFRVLNGLALPLSVVTLYLAVPMAVLGAISFLLHLALGSKIEPDPGWVVAVVGSAVWTIGFGLSCVAVTKLESWYQPKSRQLINPRNPHRSRTGELPETCGFLTALALLWLALFIYCCHSVGLLMTLMNPLLLAGATGWMCVLLTRLNPERAERRRKAMINLFVLGVFLQLGSAGTQKGLAMAGGSDFWPGLVTLAPDALRSAYLGAFCLSFWWYTSWSSPNRHRWWMILGLVHLEVTVLLFFEGLPPEGPHFDFAMFLLIGFSPWVLAIVDGWQRRRRHEFRVPGTVVRL